MPTKPTSSSREPSAALPPKAIDVTFPFVFNYYDPIIDAIAMFFGLYRPVKDSKTSPEHWHYERVGIPYGNRTEIEPMILP